MTAGENETERGSERQCSSSHCYTDPPRRPAHSVMWAAFNNAWTSTAAAKGSQNPRQNQIAFIHELIQAQAAAGEAQRARREAGRRCVRKKDGGSHTLVHSVEPASVKLASWSARLHCIQHCNNRRIAVSRLCLGFRRHHGVFVCGGGGGLQWASQWSAAVTHRNGSCKRATCR